MVPVVGFRGRFEPFGVRRFGQLGQFGVYLQAIGASFGLWCKLLSALGLS